MLYTQYIRMIRSSLCVSTQLIAAGPICSLVFNPLNIYMYTLDYSESQLMRLYEHIDHIQHIRIISVLRQGWEYGSATDRFMILVDCEPKTYTMLLLL